MTHPIRMRWLPLFALALALTACGEDNPGLPLDEDPATPVGFVVVPAGSFIMGSPETEPGHREIEVEHQITLTHSFWMQATEVTNSQFLRLARWALANEEAAIFEEINQTTEETIYVLRDLGGNRDFLYVFNDQLEIGYDAVGDSIFLQNAGQGITPDNPVIGLTWWGAAAYCNWLGLSEGREALYDRTTWAADLGATTGYRLPTEAEWEYAARAGSRTAYPNSQIEGLSCADPDSLRYQAWYCANSPDGTKMVAQLWPNAFGLYDMHGNVWEFCNDWFDPDYYVSGPQVDPPGPAAPGPNQPQLRIARGGSWKSAPILCRSAQRGIHFLRLTSQVEGLRPVLLRADKE